MSITATINSPDLLKQANILKHFPEITAKHYRPALKSAVAALDAAIRPNIPSGASGWLADSFGTKVLGRNIENLKGQVGWFDKGDAWYAHIVESGATSHTIQPRGSNISATRAAQNKGATRVLAWMDGGGFVFAKSVSHPGFSKRGFMAAGYAVTKPIVESELGAAGEKVVAELAVI